jgi:exonuclease SbcC
VRPLELTLEGFRSHRDRHIFTFEDRSLFAIVGPTGAGKSSILEAIVFALYGKTVREERATKNLINSRSDEARVQLLFDADGSVWEVTRVLRRRGASQFVIRNNDEDAPAATGEKAVNAKVVELLGLDFEAFCSSVMLAQGDFDRFLRAAPGPRSKILKGVFGLERVDALREGARAQTGNLQGRLQTLQSELESLPSDPSLLVQLRVDLKEADSGLAEIRNALDETGKAEQELQTFDAQVGALDQRLERIETSWKSIPEVADLEELGGGESRAAREVASTNAKVEALTKALGDAQEQLEKTEKDAGGQVASDGARDLERLRRQVKTTEAEQRKNEIALENAQRNAADARQVFDTAEKERSEAEGEVAELHRTHATHLLRKSLLPGEPCPVCEQEVSSPPKPGRVARLDTAEKLLKAATNKSGTARVDLEKATHSAAVIEERRRQCSTQLDGAADEIEAITAALTEILGEVKDPVEEARARFELVKRAEISVRAAKEEHDEAEKKARVAEKKSEEIAARRRRLAAVLIEVCGAIQIPAPSVDSDSDELLDASKRANDICVALVEDTRKERKELESLLVERRKMVAGFRSKYGLAEGEPLTKALENQTVRAGDLRNKIETVEKGLARAKKIGEETTILAVEKDRYARLAADLTDHRFTAYLLDGRRRLLAQLGSEKLFELTGRYRFDDEGEFQIVDETNGTTRMPETLSGGETFLASLALALGLAEVVAQQGGRLNCFFLDEGFGSLDQASLDLALDGIEAIATPGRVIGLISHVGGIQARVDDLIVLDKSRDGSTEVVQTEGPLAYEAATI